jgi:hypothetical protein
VEGSELPRATFLIFRVSRLLNGLVEKKMQRKENGCVRIAVNRILKRGEELKKKTRQKTIRVAGETMFYHVLFFLFLGALMPPAVRVVCR